MSEPALPDKVVAVHENLARARIAHAFGGALALAYYAEPRATIDIDINVFVAPAAHAQVQSALRPLGVGGLDPVIAERDGQCRTWWGSTPIDLFFAYDEIHDAMRREARNLPFGEDRLPVLAPEHLVVCKIVFDRPKDWLDIEQVLVCVEDLDLPDIRAYLDRLVGAEDPRRDRFEQTIAAVLDG
ncbi:MAG TPA: nucleotidyl transferase AbiEii/AbiGii toxin family protein [Solirubrobacteraceae bacterium]